MHDHDFKPEDLFSQISGLQAALERERAARARAEQDNAAKSEMLATVAHELRTPLGAIISMADLLQSSGLAATQQSHAETLHHSARGLLTVLNHILDFSKLDAGCFELDAEDFDLHDLMGRVDASLAARGHERGLATSVEIMDGCPATVTGDAVRLRQILDNLTDNALKFTDEGAVRILVGAEDHHRDVVLKFEVRDTGAGLSEDERARLFKPFSQGGRSVANRYGGTGLGLSIARKLSQLMGGAIGCSSAKGDGSTFWFTVRLAKAAVEPDAVPEAIGSALHRSHGAGLAGHVLVVEDHGINQMLITTYLDSFGLTHETVSNGAEAVAAVQQGPFGLVLMDIMMPVMDGLEATRRIRALSAPACNTPIVALTANAMRGDRETYLGAGMDGYVSKPISVADLFAALGEFLGPSGAAGAVQQSSVA